MHVVPKQEPMVLLVRRDGEVQYFQDYKDFIINVKDSILTECGNSFREKNPNFGFGVLPFFQERYYRYIIKYDTGEIIPRLKAIRDKNELRNDDEFYYLIRYGRKKVVYWYRRDPVPNTRKRKGSKRYFRSIKTTHERRWYLAWEDDNVFGRKKRSNKNLPNSYDDINRQYHKNWKHFRKHQWKE